MVYVFVGCFHTLGIVYCHENRNISCDENVSANTNIKIHVVATYLFARNHNYYTRRPRCFFCFHIFILSAKCLPLHRLECYCNRVEVITALDSAMLVIHGIKQIYGYMQHVSWYAFENGNRGKFQTERYRPMCFASPFYIYVS